MSIPPSTPTYMYITVDVIMDMLGNVKTRQIIIENYQQSTERRLIENAIKRGRYVGEIASINVFLHMILDSRGGHYNWYCSVTHEWHGLAMFSF